MANNNYLVHHGIDGQKWGRRNGPPYPLKKWMRSSAERRAVRAKVRTEKKQKKREESEIKKQKKREESEIKKQKKAAAEEAFDRVKYYEKLKKRDISKLTDDELKTMIDRLTVEKTYYGLLKDLTPEKKQKAESWVSKAAKDAGTNIIKEVGTGAGKGLSSNIEKMLNELY